MELLSLETELRVNSPNGASRRGFLVRADRRTLTLRVGQHEIPVDRRDIDRVAVNRGTHHRKNLISTA